MVWSKIKYFPISKNCWHFYYDSYFYSIEKDCLFSSPPLKITRATDILECVKSFFAKENLALKKKLGNLQHRRSTCEAWQQPWLCCLGEERSSTQDCESLLSKLAYTGNKNTARNPKRIFVYRPESCQLYQRQGLEDTDFLRNMSRRWQDNPNLIFSTQKFSHVPKPWLNSLQEFKRERAHP